MIKSIAIFGATEKHVSELAEIMALNNNRLLLFSDGNQDISDLRNHILLNIPSADIELFDCSAEASWQADTIILALTPDKQEMIAAGIEDFVTQKTVIAFVDSVQEASGEIPSKGLQNRLPNAHVIYVHIAYDQDQQKIFYAGGSDDDALNEAIALLTLAGFIPGESQPLITL